MVVMLVAIEVVWMVVMLVERRADQTAVTLVGMKAV